MKNLYFVFCIILNILILNNQYATGHTVNDLIKFIEKNNLNQYYVDYGNIFPHRPVFFKKNSGQYEISDKNSPKYLMTKTIQKKKEMIYFSCRGIFLIKNCYYLVKTN